MRMATGRAPLVRSIPHLPVKQCPHRHAQRDPQVQWRVAQGVGFLDRHDRRAASRVTKSLFYIGCPVVHLLFGPVKRQDVLTVDVRTSLVRNRLINGRAALHSETN